VTTKHRLSAAVLIGMVTAALLPAQSLDPLIGTWKLNVAKSKGSTLKGGSTVVEAAGKGLKFSVEFVAADGTVSKWAFTANLDGKDVPVTGNSPYGDTASLARVGANTTIITSKQDGKVTVTSTIVVAPDGKTRTSTSKGTDVKGQTVDTVAVYERQ
jgi:hypothetical protein